MQNKDLQNRFNKFLNASKEATTPEEVAKYWDDFYEISGGQGLKARQAYARYFYDKLARLDKDLIISGNTDFDKDNIVNDYM